MERGCFQIKDQTTTEEIVNSYAFLKLYDVKRHCVTNTAAHSIRTAKYMKAFAKWFGLDEETAIKVALLHDLCYITGNSKKEKKGLYAFYHAQDAVENAEKYYGLTELERNAISAHMFPLSKEFPKSGIAWSLTVADKAAAIVDIVAGTMNLIIGERCYKERTT